MTPTGANPAAMNLLDALMQRLGYPQADDASPSAPPRAVPPMLQFSADRSQYNPGALPLRGTVGDAPQQPGSMALNPLQMPTQAPQDLQPPAPAPALGEARTPAALPPMGIPYAAPEPQPQREASMTQDAGTIPAAAERTPQKPPESSFLSNAAQFISGMRTGGAITDLAGGYKAVEGRNATRDFLAQKGLPAETIAAMEADPRIYAPVMADLFSNKTQVINNKLVNSLNGRVIADFSDAAVKGPDVKEFTLPDGSKVTGVWNAKTGRHELPNGQPIPVGTQSGDIPAGVNPQTYRQEMGRKTADAVSTARVTLPETMRMLDDQIKLIDQVSGDTNLTKAIGPYNSRLPTWANPQAADVGAKLKQLSGGAFLQAFQALKGSGAISNAEGAKAEMAINRLGAMDQSDDGYKAALADAKSAMVEIRDIVQRRASGDFAPRAAERLPDGMSADAIKAEARQAIANGKDPVGVRAKLQRFGITLD